MPSLHPEVDRLPDDLEHQSQGQAVVGTPGPGDEASASLTGRLKDERPGHRGGIVAEHQSPLRLDSPHDKTILGLRCLREDVADLDLLKLWNDPVRARDTSVVQAVVAVPASAPAPHLDQPRPDLGGTGTDRDRVRPPNLRVGHPLVTRERSLRLIGKRTNRTPRHHGRHDGTQEPRRISNEPHEPSITTHSRDCEAPPPGSWP